MDSEIITWLWLGFGLLLIAAELFTPGLVTVFMGLSALGVAILRWVGAIEGLPASFMTWAIGSLVMVLTMRKAALKWFPADKSKANIDEDLEAYGKVVKVESDIVEGSTDGRIRFQGTSWAATCNDGRIAAGQQARIVFRDNLVWVVEPVDDDARLLEGPSGVKVPEKVSG